MKSLAKNIALCFAGGALLAACGGGDSSGSADTQSQLLADGEACNAAWSSSTAYNGGMAVSYGGRNYTAAYWTQNNNPSTSSGSAGSGQPWTTGFTCGGGATTTTTASATTTTASATTTTSSATTTTASTSCSYANWSSGVNYSLGTIVKYATNGNYYKVVNVGTNGSDGTDPTISTWYWSQHTCTGGTTTTVGGTTTTTGSSGGFVVSEAQFNQMFPDRIPFYTYSGLMTALSFHPTFAKSGDITKDKQEAAAFFANLHHESDHLRAVREYNTANWPLYCSYGIGQCGGKEYYGRGPIQLSWNYNYATAGAALGLDLLNNPDLVATDAAVAWRTAIWYWMTSNGPNDKTAHTAMVGGYGFGQTIKTINGARECVGGIEYQGPAQMQVRVNYYNSFTTMLGVAPGNNLTC